MFNVNGIVAQGRFGFHQDRVCPGVANLMFSLCLPSCFALAYSRGALFHGSPSSDGNVVHRPLWSALGCDRPRDVLVAPIFEAGQITILLYAQGRSGVPIEPMIVGRMENVCSALDSVLARIPA